MTEPVRPLEALKRYDLVLTGSGYYTSNEMERADDGEWVRFDELAALLQAAAPPAPTAEPACIWKEEPNGEYWESACGETWTFMDGTPSENNARFCHGCGKPIQAVSVMEQIDDDDESPAAPPERVSEGKDRNLQRICGVAADNLVRAETAEAKYHELLYAVGNKHQGENRHETALRYIRQAETSSGPHSGAARPAVEPREEK